MTTSKTITVSTQGFTDVHDLTPAIARFVDESALPDGVAVIFVPGSTAGVTTIEFEDGAVKDFKAAIERMAPRGMHYDHDARWGDGNGFAHVRAAMLGPSLSVPVVNGSLALGTWQQIILVDFDNRKRNREVILTVIAG
jgi:secondary thiamine-phosphate synthase enzyme